MKASVQYGDFKGTAAADISDFLGVGGDNLQSFGKYFGLNEDRFKVIGLSIYGTGKFGVSLICVDKERSTPEKEYIVNMSVEREKKILDQLFKRFNVVLHDRFDEKYPVLNYDTEANFSDFHQSEED